MFNVSLKFISAAILIAVLTGIFIISRAELAPTEEQERLTVSVLTVESQLNYEVTRYFPAIAEAQQTVAIGSEIPGKIVSVYADDGDQVAMGQPLFELDLQLLETQKQSIQAQVLSIKPELTLASKRLERQLNLKQNSFSSEDNIDALKARKSALEASITSLEAQINDIDIRISKSTVYAPFDATVQRRVLDEGAVIDSGMPVIHLVSDSISEVTTGLPADLVATLNFDDTYEALYRDEVVPVKLSRILPEINPVTRTQGVKFTLESPVNLTASDYLKLILPSQYEGQGFWIPNTALIEGPRGVWEVFVVSDADRIKKFTVDIIYASNPQSYVSSAIPDGSRIVVEGVHRLAQNVAVKVADYL